MDGHNVRELELWLYGGVCEPDGRRELERRASDELQELEGPRIGTVSFDPATRTVYFNSERDSETKS
jgi:hypothetical protein